MTALVARRRDVASSILRPRDVVPSRTTLLASPTQAALRAEVPSLLAWLVGAGLLAFALGAFARSVSEEMRKVSIHTYGLSITTAAGYLAAVFALFALIVAIFAASHVGGLRDEESSGRLETLFALPVARRSWIGGRLAVAAATTVLLALALGTLAWAGAAVTGGGVGFAGMIDAGANCIAVSLLFLALGVLLYAWLPRPSPGAAFVLIAIAFLWELVGALVGAPVVASDHLTLPPRDPGAPGRGRSPRHRGDARCGRRGGVGGGRAVRAPRSADGVGRAGRRSAAGWWRGQEQMAIDDRLRDVRDLVPAALRVLAQYRERPVGIHSVTGHHDPLRLLDHRPAAERALQALVLREALQGDVDRALQILGVALDDVGEDAAPGRLVDVGRILGLEHRDHRAGGLVDDLPDQVERVLRIEAEPHQGDVGTFSRRHRADLGDRDLACDHLMPEPGYDRSEQREAFELLVRDEDTQVVRVLVARCH